jgi:gliding motility-associated-like protein
MQHAIKGKLLLFSLMYFISGWSQFTPVSVTGFNQDAIAEAGPSSLATTTIAMDAAASNKVMYTEAFRVFAGIGGGGLPDNGTITSAAMTFQLANYSGNNALCLFRGQSGSLDLATPASFARLRVLCLATEANVAPANALVNMSLTFTDGTTVPYVTNIGIADWFNGTTNQVLTGFGRCGRVAAAPWGADGFPSNPRMYYIEITLNCTDIAKLVQRINISNVTVAGSNAPFPNEVFLAVSGIPYSIAVTPVIVPSDCDGPNGSIALTVTGSSAPYTYSWNTSPVQTGATASGLAPGNYTCTITDANGCASTYNGTVTLNNNAVITATASPAVLCAGGSSTLTATATTGTMSSWTWTPGTATGTSINVSPANTTTYTVNATNAIGCTASAQVTVTVNNLPAAPVVPDVAVCPGGNATLVVQGPQAGYTYEWYSTATGGTVLATGTSYTVTNVTAAATYYVEAVSGPGCRSSSRTAVNITLSLVPAAPSANAVSVCSGSNALLQVQNPQAGFTYNWYNAATGGAPAGTGVNYSINNVTAAATYYVEAVNSSGCTSTVRTAVNISLLQPLTAPVATLIDATFTSLTFSWNAVPGATGYEVTTNGGATYTLPSSGSTGTTHTITGLMGNTTITFQVRATGGQSCETSAWSVPVSGTTLSSKEIFVPNVFTPNGDGKNDILYVYGNYVSSVQFRVFNQWGQLIFVSDNIGRGWDGKYNGQQQPVGVYAYSLKVTLQDGTVINKKGSISLIR